MNRRRFVLTSAAALAAPTALARNDARRSSVDLAAILDATKTPGLAAQGIVRGVPFAHYAGVRQVEKPDPVTASTWFSAASLTKPVFAMEVRRLVREGKLDWNRPLQDYLPLGLEGDAAKITIAHVLTHSTGLVNWRFDPKETTLVSSFPPGTRWQYSGEGYVLLQRVVESIAGQPLGRYLNTTLLPRLSMTSSSFTWTPQIDAQTVAGHTSLGKLLERSSNYYARQSYELAQKVSSTPADLTYDQMIEAARNAKSFAMPVGVAPNVAGSLWTTAADYATFLSKTIADARAHRDEYTPRVKVNNSIDWTLSWGVDSSLGRAGYFHWGDGPGVKNFTWWEPSTNTAIVIFTNGDHGASAYRLLLRRLLDADPIAPEWV